MKRRTALLILCIVVVNACSPAPQVTATSEATVTSTPPPTMTDTPVPAPTVTETPLETPHIEDFIKITSSFPIEIEGSESTPRIVGACKVGEELCYGCEIKMPEALAKEILGGYMARFMHRFGAEGQEGQPSEEQIAAALARIAQAQRGEIPASEAVMTIPAYLLSQGLSGKYSEVKIVFRMGTDMEVPEGVIPIDTLSTLDVKGHNWQGEVGFIPVREGIPGFVKTHEAGVGFGTVVDESDKRLLLVGSPDYLFKTSQAALRLAVVSILRNKWIEEFDGNNRPKLSANNVLYKRAEEEHLKVGFEVVK